MLDCTCMNGSIPNSRGRKKTCRHMFLVNRVLNKSFEWEQHVKRRLLPINQVILGSEPRKRFHDAYDIPWEKAQLLIAGNHKDKVESTKSIERRMIPTVTLTEPKIFL